MNTMLEELEEPNTIPPKLLLLPQRSKRPDLHDGFSSPPQTIATIPFQWEVAPGKPRSTTTPTANDPPPLDLKSIRSLDLPPRMFNSTTSPTTVLCGPSGGMHNSCSPDRMVSKSTCMMMPWGKSTRKETSSTKSNSWSWDRSQYISSKGGGGGDICSSYMSFDDLLNTLESRTKTNKGSRSRSFVLFSRATSSVMESMHESINLAGPWRR